MTNFCTCGRTRCSNPRHGGFRAEECDHLNEEVTGTDATNIYYRCKDCNETWAEGR